MVRARAITSEGAGQLQGGRLAASAAAEERQLHAQVPADDCRHNDQPGEYAAAQAEGQYQLHGHRRRGGRNGGRNGGRRGGWPRRGGRLGPCQPGDERIVERVTVEARKPYNKGHQAVGEPPDGGEAFGQGLPGAVDPHLPRQPKPCDAPAGGHVELHVAALGRRAVHAAHRQRQLEPLAVRNTFAAIRLGAEGPASDGDGQLCRARRHRPELAGCRPQ
eukprot:scaffold8488_cov101-Isochrysis_galbana.AAC.3